MERELERQMSLIASGAAEILTEKELKEKLAASVRERKPLRIKMGIDPTAPDVHLGHMVVYRKIRQFQDQGHKAVLIIGDYTARIGDPTGRNAERQPLTEEEVRRNCRTYQEQIFKVVDESKTEIRYQSEWFDSVSLQDILSTASAFSVAHMLTHETFRKRLDDGNRLSLHELFYPALQAWDSIFVKSDVEMGGLDQKFNILCGRDLQRSRGMKPQTALFMPLLEGTDGRKMSKSFGNHIPVNCPPSEKFGKIMSLSDRQILDYFLFCTDKTPGEVEAIGRRLERENPRDIKLELAGEIVRIFHSRTESETCREDFLNVFSRGHIPVEMPQYDMAGKGENLTSLLKKAGVVVSVSEARRLINQGGLKLNGEKISDPDFVLKWEKGVSHTIRAGKRRFLKVCCKG